MWANIITTNFNKSINVQIPELLKVGEKNKEQMSSIFYLEAMFFLFYPLFLLPFKIVQKF